MIKFGPSTPTIRYTGTLTPSRSRSTAQSERVMNIEPTFDPFLIESPICSCTWIFAIACTFFLKWWWILTGAYFRKHIVSWFVWTISALTLSHHYSSLKLFVCSTLDGVAAIERPRPATVGKSKMTRVHFSVFILPLLRGLKVSD